MARRCAICGKGPQFGSQVSHSHKVTKKKRLPNLHRIRAEIDGKIKRIYVCSDCLSAGKVKKVI